MAQHKLIPARRSSGTFTMRGPLLFSPDNTYDIGAAAATRPRSIYVGTNVQIGGAAPELRINVETGAASGTVKAYLAGVEKLAYGVAGAADGLITGSLTGDFCLRSDGFNILFSVDSGVSVNWKMASTGHLLCPTDNTYDIGASLATRPRTGYFGTSVLAPALSQNGANGQLATVQHLTELTTIAAAATTDTAIQLPANAVILGVSVRTTVVIPTAATYTVGDSGSAARFNTAAVSAAANSTDPGTKAGAYYNASATAVRITPNATPGNNSGRVRVTIHYLSVTPPTS